MKTMHRSLILIVAAALMLGALAACQPAAAAAPSGEPEYVLSAKDYTFEAPAELPAGRVWIRFENHGAEPHHLQFLRLNDGVSLEQFQAELREKGDAALALTTLPGGVGVLAPDGQGRVLLDLKEGQYVLMCFIPDAQGVPHLAKGMNVPIRVVGRQGDRPADPPYNATVTLRDFNVELPRDIRPGRQLWKVTNEGPQPHEVMILKLADGKTAEDAVAWLREPQGAAPFEWHGGMQALTAGDSAWLDVTLRPGRYVAFCQVPDAGSGMPHVHLGMVSAFEVK